MKCQLLNAGDSAFKELNSLTFTDEWGSLDSLVTVVSHLLIYVLVFGQLISYPVIHNASSF